MSLRVFFERALRYMEENHDVGIIGPKILNGDGSVQGSARSFPTLLTAFFGRNSLLTNWFPDNRITRQNVHTSKCAYHRIRRRNSYDSGLGFRSLYGGEEKSH